jgi:hypothetical protein
MTSHFSPEEFVDAAEGTLDAGRAAHLQSCAACAAEAASLRTVLRGVAPAGDVPEPSPLFWDHMSARVHAAVAADAPSPWRPRIGWQSIAAVSALAAAMLLLVVMRPAGPGPGPETVMAEVAPGETWLPALDDGSFDVVLEMASELEWDEVRQVAAPRAGTVEAMIQELSPAEREELVRLLRSEMGELE